MELSIRDLMKRRGAFRTSHQILESENGALHLRRAQSHAHY